ncbi:hypothetical protein ON010_g4704 [Phytophthora cinnamomi]|nr:hypothetical protein ON010_g4704 [Phytophthora cinnamomi]
MFTPVTSRFRRLEIRFDSVVLVHRCRSVVRVHYGQQYAWTPKVSRSSIHTHAHLGADPDARFLPFTLEFASSSSLRSLLRLKLHSHRDVVDPPDPTLAGVLRPRAGAAAVDDPGRSHHGERRHAPRRHSVADAQPPGIRRPADRQGRGARRAHGAERRRCGDAQLGGGAVGHLAPGDVLRHVDGDQLQRDQGGRERDERVRPVRHLVPLRVRGRRPLRKRERVRQRHPLHQPQRHAQRALRADGAQRHPADFLFCDPGHQAGRPDLRQLRTVLLEVNGYRARRVPRARTSRARKLLLDLDDGLDLHRHVERQGVGAHGRARVLALVAEDGGHSVRRAVDHARLGRERVHAVDEARELHHALDVVQLAQFLCATAVSPSLSDNHHQCSTTHVLLSVASRANATRCAAAYPSSVVRSLPSLPVMSSPAAVTGRWPAIDTSRGMTHHVVARAHDVDVVALGSARGGQLVAELGQTVLDLAHAVRLVEYLGD